MAPPDRPRSSRPSGGPPHTKREDGGEPGPKQWGALARRGSRRLSEDIRDAGTKPPHQGPPAPKEAQDVWVRDEVRSTAERAVRRGARAAPADGQAKRQARKRGDRHDDERAGAELARAVGGGDRAAKVGQRLKDATRAFEREQYSEARRLLRPLAQEAPTASAVRELLGLTYYRLGSWTQAVRELEAFRALTGSTEQNPVLADSYRALKRWPAIDELWAELREASPSADLVAEGRIVVAGSLADRRRLPEAIAVLEKAKRPAKRPQIHHLRVAYALADLRERSGDVPGARDLFAWVAHHEPDFADAHTRAESLR